MYGMAKPITKNEEAMCLEWNNQCAQVQEVVKDDTQDQVRKHQLN